MGWHGRGQSLKRGSSVKLRNCSMVLSNQNFIPYAKMRTRLNEEGFVHVTYEIGQASIVIFLSFTFSISLGCFAREKLESIY